MSRQRRRRLPLLEQEVLVGGPERAAVDELTEPIMPALAPVSNICFNQVLESVSGAEEESLRRCWDGSTGGRAPPVLGGLRACSRSWSSAGRAGGSGPGFTDEVRLGDTDSQQASDLLTDRFPAAAGDTATLVISLSTSTARLDTAPARPVGSVVTAVAAQPDVESVTPVQVSADGRNGYTRPSSTTRRRPT